MLSFSLSPRPLSPLRLLVSLCVVVVVVVDFTLSLFMSLAARRSVLAAAPLVAVSFSLFDGLTMQITSVCAVCAGHAFKCALMPTPSYHSVFAVILNMICPDICCFALLPPVCKSV